MTNDNYLLEIKKIANKRKKKNNKKKRLIKVFNTFLILVMIFCVYIFWNAIKPTVLEYVRWLSSPLVCIDAGHGGEQTGATYNGRIEKDDNLELAILVRDILKDKGIRVTMTRDKDETLSLQDRTKYANRKHVSLFVSLHRNYSDNIEASGIEIWAGKEKSDNEKVLGNNLLNELLKCEYTNNRGLRFGSSTSEHSDYYVILKTDMPSVIVETGFISNIYDNALYDENINEYANAICDGIIKTLQELYPDEMINETIKYKK